jgi:uncharacterized protein (DUF433 family)
MLTVAAPKQQPTPVPRRIVRVPGVCGGDPIVEGTRVPVASIVVTYQYYHDLERVHGAYPRVDIPTIKAALTYYEENREEIDRLIEEDDRAADALE